jgi:hypothetical protein
MSFYKHQLANFNVAGEVRRQLEPREDPAMFARWWGVRRVHKTTQRNLRVMRRPTDQLLLSNRNRTLAEYRANIIRY